MFKNSDEIPPNYNILMVWAVYMAVYKIVVYGNAPDIEYHFGSICSLTFIFYVWEKEVIGFASKMLAWSALFSIIANGVAYILYWRGVEYGYSAALNFVPLVIALVGFWHDKGLFKKAKYGILFRYCPVAPNSVDRL